MTHLDYVPALLCKTLTTLISEFYHCNIWLVVCGTTSVDSLLECTEICYLTYLTLLVRILSFLPDLLWMTLLVRILSFLPDLLWTLFNPQWKRNIMLLQVAWSVYWCPCALQLSRAALQRYLFYCNRYMNHMQSLKSLKTESVFHSIQ